MEDADAEGFGDALRRLRTARGFTQRQLGDLIRFDHAYITKTERGSRQPTLDFASACDRALGSTPHLTKLAEEEREMKRRTLLAVALGATLPGQVPVSVGAPADDTAWAGMLRRVFLTAPAAFAALTYGAADLSNRRDDRLDPELIQGLVGAAASYRRAYHAVPASRLLTAALGHLDLVLSLRPSARSDSERLPLITAAGEMATLGGVLLGLDAARHTESLSYFDIAWTAARAVADIELQTVVLACRSFVLAYGDGDHAAGLECADLARSVGATGASIQTRAWVAAVASERCADLGDLGGSQQRLDESRAVLALSDPHDTVWRGVGGYDSAKLCAYEGGNLMRLHRFADAEPILADALSKLDQTMTRHRATALLDLATARFGLNDIDAACADAGRALTLVTHVQHSGHLDRISALSARGMKAGAQSARSLHRELQLTRVDNGLPIVEGIS